MSYRKVTDWIFGLRCKTSESHLDNGHLNFAEGFCISFEYWIFGLHCNTSASHLDIGYSDFAARLLHLTSPSHLDTRHFKLIQLRFY